MHNINTRFRRAYNSFDCWHSARLIPSRDRKEDGAARIANQRRRGRFAIRDPCMRNALMGNTCYVVATVTIADWRMTVGFRALLMAVCRRPSLSRSLIPDTSDLRSRFTPFALRYRLSFIFRSATFDACAAKLFTESRFSRPDFVHHGS